MISHQTKILFALVVILSHFSLPLTGHAQGISTPQTSKTDASTLEHYVATACSAGKLVIIDSYDASKFQEKLENVPALNSDFSSTFYDVRYENNICRIYPKNIESRSSFLTQKITDFSVKDLGLAQSIEALGSKCGVKLGVNNPYNQKMTIPMVDFRDKTAEQILIEVAKACGSKRVVLSPLLDMDGRQVPNATIIISFCGP